jgi:hypothetical protein
MGNRNCDAQPQNAGIEAKHPVPHKLEGTFPTMK